MQLLSGPCRVSTEWPEVNSGITYTERVHGACHMTLLQYYATKHAASAFIEQWRAAILAGQMAVNGQPVCDPNMPIPPGATLVHHRPGWAEPPAPAHLDILWWDAHIVAVHKPSGLQVLPAGPVYERCALTLLRLFHQQHAGELSGMPAPVHRLGRGTSGVLLCACSEAARSALSREFAEHGLERGLEHGLLKDRGRMRKVYRALVQGLVEQDEAEVNVPIGRVEYSGVRGGLFAARPGGGVGAKASRSRYAVLLRDAAAGTTLVNVEIFTGRPHQIRIHMAAVGHPLVGDPLYAPGGLPYDAGNQVAASAACARAEGGDAGSAGGGAADGASSVGAACDRQQQQQQQQEHEQRPVMPGDCGYHLHCLEMEFRHPISGERVIATCMPPPLLR